MQQRKRAIFWEVNRMCELLFSGKNYYPRGMTTLQPISGQVDRKRLADVSRLYALLDELAMRTHQPRLLSACSGRDNWPLRGVYFFQEVGEHKSQSGGGARIVRVGTHALKFGAKSTLWGRLSQHKGSSKSGGGNHRGSIFRLLIGTALMARDQRQCDSWGDGSSAPKDIRADELPMERLVSDVMGRMQVLCLPLEDQAGADSLRGVIERNTIALLSNANKVAIDAPSVNWLGHHCSRERVRRSGMWNQNHVDETYKPSFLNTLESVITNL